MSAAIGGRAIGARSLWAVTAVPPALWDHTDGRVSPGSRAHFRRQPLATGALIFAAYDGVVPIGVSAVALSADARMWQCAITIVHRDYRRQGIGEELLRVRMSAQRALKPALPITTRVAEDNPASVAMCQRAGLVTLCEMEAQRGAGSFTQIVFGAA